MSTHKHTDKITEMEYSLKNDFEKAVLPFLVCLASTIIIISFVKDVSKIGFNPYWLFIRLAYLPFILLIWKITKAKFSNGLYELPLWASGLYITLFCTYFSIATGGLKSDYIFGLIQFYFGIAVMPITAFSFYSLSAISIGLYVGLNISYYEPNLWPQSANISTIIPLIIFSMIVYFITSRIRRDKLNLQNTLAKTLKDREETIQFQARKLSIEREISLLAASVAHDIASPIAVMEIILHTYSKEFSSKVSSALKDSIQGIRNISSNLLEKYRNPTKESSAPTLDQTRENTEVNPTPCPVFLPEITEWAISQKRLEWIAKPCNISLNTDLHENTGWALIVPETFKRIISNLLNNAYEALQSKREITINIRASLDSFLSLSITDTGCGLAPEQLSRALEGESFKHAGKGLGLSGAKAYIEMLGGNLTISSKEGIGTTIGLLFPRTLAGTARSTNLSELSF